MHITIAGMSASGEISEKVISAAKSAGAVVLQTDLGSSLSENGVAYETLDALYQSAQSFDELTDQACAFLMRDNLLFIVLGEVYYNRIAAGAIRRIRQAGGSVTVIPGGNAALCMAFAQGMTESVQGACFFTATSFCRACDTDTVLVVGEMDTRIKASELKLKLGRYYGDEYAVYLADVRGGAIRQIPICMLDGEPSYGYYTSVVVPPCALEQKQRYTFSDLVSVMDILRSKHGCPWDKEQTHASLKRYLIEESYEVLDAIDQDDMDALYDELGDVLLQVVFHARIAQQHGEFDITDVTTAICRKMISRHTHIFGSAVAHTPDDVVQNWDQIKKGEKGQITQADVLMDVPKSMPALMRSGKVQHKAAKVGFDFRDVSEAVGKLREEICEIEQDSDHADKLSEECGDLLFSAVNVARLFGVEPEIALQKATDKFIARFALVEQFAAAQNVDMHTCGIDVLNNLWNQAKRG